MEIHFIHALRGPFLFVEYIFSTPHPTTLFSLRLKTIGSKMKQQQQLPTSTTQGGAIQHTAEYHIQHTHKPKPTNICTMYHVLN